MSESEKQIESLPTPASATAGRRGPGRRLEGKRILLTAAGQGIGRASALAMADEGAIVFATDVNEEALASLQSERPSSSRIETYVMNVLDDDSVRSGVARAEPIDALFNCAGYVHSGTVLDCTDEEWEFAFDLNVRSMFRTIRAALPGMLERASSSYSSSSSSSSSASVAAEERTRGGFTAGGCSIINMSSVASSVKGAPDRFVYGATKAAVVGLTKSVAIDYVSKGVRCNCICPGTVDSPSLHERLRATGDYDGAMARFVARQPMGRIACPEEVAALVVYLASDESSFSTGGVHVIDGGWSL